MSTVTSDAYGTRPLITHSGRGGWAGSGTRECVLTLERPHQVLVAAQKQSSVCFGTSFNCLGHSSVNLAETGRQEDWKRESRVAEDGWTPEIGGEA